MEQVLNLSLTRLRTDEANDQEAAFVRVLDSRIVGQESGKAAAARAIRRAHNKLRNKRGPVYRLLQIGKSRTGKTLTAETTALALHGDSDALIRVDCAEYQHGHEVSRLLGAPPSYLGYDDPNKGEGGADKGDKGDKADKQFNPAALLAQKNLIASRKGSTCPYTIILLDEIEKCSDSLLDVLLAIFDRGKIRLANNTEVDFTNCIFFMTSNLGMDKVEKLGRPIGFAAAPAGPASEEDIEAVVKYELKRRFRPEFMKRVDEVVIFAGLTKEQLEKLYALEIEQVKSQIYRDLDLTEVFELKVDASVRAFIMAKALDDDGGVAEVKHVLARYLVDVLGNELSKKTILGGDLVVVSYKDGDSALSFDVGRGQGKPDIKPRAAEAGSTSTALARVGASSGVVLTTAQAKARLIELTARKLKESESEKSYSRTTINIGNELGQLAIDMGRTYTNFEDLQRVFMTSEAHRLMWNRVQNPHSYWMLISESAKLAGFLPIVEADVTRAIENIKKTVTGNLTAYQIEDPAEASALVLSGILLLQQDERTLEYTLVKNRLYM